MKQFAFLTLLAGLASASTISLNAPCATNTSLTCAADITFTFAINQLTLTVNNDLADPMAPNQLLSAIQFVLSGGSGGSLTSSSGMERTVASDGTYTDGATVAAGWAFSESGTTFTLDDLVGIGHAGPAHTLIGAPGVGGTYDNANSGIAGNPPHNPFLAGPLTFVLSISGVNSDTQVQSASFQFGTEDGHFQSNTPEPMSMLLTGVGLLGVGLIGRKSRA